MNQKEPKEVWEERVNAYRQSHMSLPKWCKENDIRVSTMKYYVYQVHKKKVMKLYHLYLRQSLMLTPIPDHLQSMFVLMVRRLLLISQQILIFSIR